MSAIPPSGDTAKRCPRHRLQAVCLLLGMLFTGAPAVTGPAFAQAVPAERLAPYDDTLLRLSEILGSVTYLRTLCAGPDAAEWRQSMQALIDQDAGGEPERKARLTAAYNRGYRSFASVYTSCTSSAVVAERRYRAEGATLAAEIVTRFGN